MKVSEKVYGLLFSAIISLIMSFFMSFFMIVINIGFTEEFMKAWLGSTAIGFVIGLPIAEIAVPLIQKFLQKHLTIIND